MGSGDPFVDFKERSDFYVSFALKVLFLLLAHRKVDFDQRVAELLARLLLVFGRLLRIGDFA